MDKISSFTGQYWNPGEAITKERMDRLEQGIESAFSLLGNKAARGNLSVFDGSLSDLFTQLNNDVLRANQNAQDAKDAVDNAQQATANGNRAWQALEDAGVIYNYSNGSYTKTLGTLLSEKATNDALGEANERIEEILTAIGDANSGIVKNINTNKTNIELIQEIINGAKDSDVPNDTLAARFGRIETDVETLGTAVNTLTTGGKGKYNTLAERLNAIDGSANKDTYRTLPAVDQEIKDARGTHVVDGETVAYDDLDSRLDADEAQIDANKTNIGTLGAEVGNTHSVTSTDPSTNLVTNVTVNLSQRFANIDENTVPQRTLPNVISEIETAHRVRVDSQTNEPIPDTLNGRFVDNETSIQDLKNKLGTGFTNASTVASRMGVVEGEINTTHRTGLVDPETSLAINDTLDIRLNDIDEHTRPTRTLPNVITEIDNAHYTRVENNQNVVYDLDMRFDAIDNGAKPTRTLPDIITEVNGAHTSTVIQEDDGEGNLVDTTYTTLNERFETIEATAKALDETLDIRINAIDEGTTPSRTLPNLISEVETAHISSVVTDEQTIEENGETSTVQVPHNYGSLDARFEAIETNIDTIATDLNMYNSQTHEIENTNTRVDMIEQNVVAMANEIGMLQDGAAVQDMNTAITAQGTRIDNIEDEIGDAHRTGLLDANEDPIEDTLVNRFEDIESDIGDIQDTLGVGFDTTTNTVAATIAAAISTAEGDATSKANAAEQNAKDYADNNKVDKTAVYNNVDAVDAGLVLDARIGKEINDKFGANFDATNTVRAAITGLDERLNQIDGGTALSENETLANRVTTLEQQPKSATTIIEADCIIYDASGSPIAIYEDDTKQTSLTPSQDVDYLLGKTEGEGQNQVTKYYYWKYKGSAPNGTWYLISGDSDVELPSNVAINASVKTLNAVNIINVNDPETEADILWPSDTTSYSGGLQIESSDNNGVNVFNDFVAVRNARITATYEAGTSKLQSQTLDILDTNGNLMSYPIIGGGGGGDISGDYYIYVHPITPQSQKYSYSYAQENGVQLKFGYTCYKQVGAEYDYLDCTYELRKDNLEGEIISSSDNAIAHQDIEDYDSKLPMAALTFNNIETKCNKNVPTTFILVLRTSYQEYNETTNQNETKNLRRQISVSVTLNELTLTSDFSAANPIATSDDLSIPFTFSGLENIEFETLVTLDNNNLPFISNNNGITILSQNLRNKVGIHNLIIRVKQTDQNNDYYSNPLNYQLCLKDNTLSEILLFSSDSLDTITTEQYQEKKIHYSLFIPDNITEKQTVVITTKYIATANDVTTTTILSTSEQQLNAGEHEFIFRRMNSYSNLDTYQVEVTCGSATPLVFNINVKRAAEQINIENNGLKFNFSPDGSITNNSTNRLWSETRNDVTYAMEIPEGSYFDWNTGGWMNDDNGVPCFCVKAGSHIRFTQTELNNNNEEVVSPLSLFWHNMENNGSNFKCTFRIENVKTPDASFLTSLDTVKSSSIAYGSTITAKDENTDEGEEDTLLSSYINTETTYIYTWNPMEPAKPVKTSIGTNIVKTTVALGMANNVLQRDIDKASSKNIKNINSYIGKMYEIIEAAKNIEHRRYLLTLCSGNNDADTVTLEQITAYLKETEAAQSPATINGQLVNYVVATNANTVYNTLTATPLNETLAAYKEAEPVNFNAILNVFKVENKESKDGIIPMLSFHFTGEIKEFTNFNNQILSDEAIATNTITGTNTYRITHSGNKIYEVNLEEDSYKVVVGEDTQTFTFNKIVDIRDASTIIEKYYGLELNALGSNIYMPSGTISYAHSEGDIIEFEYNINAPMTGRNDSTVIIYEEGVPSAAKIYPVRKNTFEQYKNNTSTAGYLTIGSDDCDVYIYKMHLYNKALSNETILANFYADGLTAKDMVERYTRNKELSKVTALTPQLVAEQCPDLRVIMIEAPTLTGGKNSFIKDTKIRCIYKNGRPVDNWVALNAYHSGQGTSSDNYGVAGRNLDIIFGFDGEDTVIIPKPQKNNYIFDPDYKSIVITGLDDDNTEEIKTAEEYETAGYNVFYNQPGQTGKVSLTETSIPNNWFNIKLNIASSDNTNNAYLQKRFDRYLKRHVYKTPAMNRDSRIKNDMEFFNCVVFIKETGTASEFTKPEEEGQWNFYGIGNIGDSKKTDSTRVNIPGDPKEFAVEISDNGLDLSGFTSGVFFISEASRKQYENDEEYLSKNNLTAIPELSEALTPTDIHVLTNEEYTFDENTNVYTINIASANISTSVLYLLELSRSLGNDKTLKYYRRYMYINSQWKEVGVPITFTKTNYGIKYPISQAEWKRSDKGGLNTYSTLLYNFKASKGWEKSFEFRYDLTTKDGETVERNDQEKELNKQRQNVNKEAFAKFYSWLVTSSDADFIDHINDYCIPGALPYWYLFTERYTMIDSRAKNTFYHYGKYYITQDEANGTNIDTLTAELAALEAEETPDEIAIANKTTELAVATFIRDNAQYFTINNIQADENHNYGYRFELWDYDDDTALGINNNGKMVFEAGYEDTDSDGNGWIFNEAESVIWRRVRKNLFTELSGLYRPLEEECFNAQSLIDEFDELQAQFPEELWRRDFERKYYRPYKEKGEVTYLSDMANGRKKYQRRQFERNMAIYIASKYKKNGSYIKGDEIHFRPKFTDDGRDTHITIIPYSNMYINYMFANTDVTGANRSDSVRVMRGEEFTVNVRDWVSDFNNTQCIIYNSSRIMGISGLGKFSCEQFSLASAKKLSTLQLGDPDWSNEHIDEIGSLGLGSATGLPILENLDIQNIIFTKNGVQNPQDSLSLPYPLLKILNANNTNIRSFEFAAGGMLTNVIFPSNITALKFDNLYKLTSVTIGSYNNLTSYESINSYSNSYPIVKNMLLNAGVEGITLLKLNDIVWEIENLIELEPLTHLQQRLGEHMLLQGTITITGQWSSVKLADYKEIFGINNITWITTSAAIPEYKLSFYLSTEDYNNGNEYYIEYRSPADQQVEVALGSDPVYSGNCPTPTKASTISHTYYFGTDIQNYYPWSGWQILNSSQVLSSTTTIQGNTALIAIFGEATRSYPLCWYLHEEDEQNGVEPVKNINILYGDSYEDGIAPTVFDLKKTGKVTASLTPLADGINCTYDIFKGWAKNPINLDSSFFNQAKDKFCIYGTWEHGTEAINDIKNQELLDAKKLLVLTNSSQANSILPVNSTITINMGHDNDTGTILVGAGSTQRLGEQRVIYDGSSEQQPILSFTSYNNALYPTVGYTNVTPLSDMTSRGFTLAIDYQINVDYISSLWNTGGYVILGGCYSTVSTVKQGFALYYDIAEQVTKVCFGNLDEIDTYTQQCCPVSSIAGTESRNIIVIRHRANTDELDVYSGVSPNSGMVLSLNLNMLQTLTWSKNTTDAPLCFGHFTSTAWNKLGQVHYGAGTSIHWAKYWDSDLGHNECVHLASWPHETITFALEDYSNDGDQDIINTNSKNIIFSALSLSQYGGPYYTTYSTSTNGSTVRWGTTLDNNSNSNYKKIANQRFFLGLPIELQSIINITYNTAIVTRLNKPSVGNAYYSINTTDTSTDLVFLPSYAEVGGNTGGSYYSGYLDEANAPMPWYKAANTSVISYNNGSFDFDNETLNQNYMNLRFLGVPINIGAGENRVYVGYNGATPVYNKIINNNNNTIKTGDIFIRTYTDEYQNTISEAYIYADGLAKAQGAPTILAANNSLFYCASGGWVKSGSWWTRSPSSFPATEQVKANSQPIYYVDKATGTVTPQGVPDNVGGYFVYEFGI